ncbi:response regulator transcription factor [Rossellomorea sp. SC111]|uniref:response regulator transcription factor n=1 Tax=Rossellomorea sp. SC111 TaxID=2968985 RepID=UPI00215AFFB8|nr:response regulator transcription factor [Rossellomorea sp. SC111]MCR8848071.1 response regulator transcription factor [Rossellomorea sp. SC111]
MNTKILVVDDDPDIRNLISVYLENEGIKTVQAEYAVDALKLLSTEDVDLVILDVMMPQMSGIEACMKIREERHMPIIMLSAKSEDMDKIQGLASGADDYLTKPFNPLELTARVKSQLRRYRRYNGGAERNQSTMEIGNLTVDTGTRQVFAGEKEIRLTPKEFAILELLARNRGKVLSVSQIYEGVWKEAFFKSDNTVMVHITNIREKIEEDPKRPVYIKTVWGVGYKL